MLWYRPMEYKVMPLTELVWSETFKNLDAWNWDDLIVSSEHRTHSSYLDPVTGEVDPDQPWHKTPMRHAALYDEYRDECQFIENGVLVMKGHAVKVDRARCRDNFVDAQNPDLVHRYGEYDLYGGWLSTKRRFTPGCEIEVEINLEGQCMQAHRFSIWLVATNGKMYGQTVQFCEIDMLEAEDAPSVPGYPFANHGLMKIVGGKIAGDTAGGQVDFSKLGINIRKGWHRIKLKWNENGSLEFYVDDILCNVDDRTMNNPPDGVAMEAQLILSDEMTSGVKGLDAQPWQNRTTGPRVPKDDGLFGNSVILDIEKMDEHKVYIRSVKEFRMREGKVEGPIDPSVSAEELAQIIEDYEQRLRELRQMVNELTQERDGVTQTLNTLLQAIQVLRDA